jgi:glycosyltransferase involved in cell wall biosynthesis
VEALMARIGIVIYSLAGAGAERVAVNLAHEFLSVGHQVDFVLARHEGELLASVPGAAGVFHADVASAAGWRDAIEAYAGAQRPDVLLAMMEGAGVLALKAMRGFRRVPVYVVSHVHFSRHCRSAVRWKERLLMPLAARWYLPRAAGVIGVSAGVSADICRAAGLREAMVHTIYNPILTEEFYRLAAQPATHAWLAPSRDWLTVVTVGRLTAQKSHETLLRAIRTVKASRPVRLLIVGQGERRNALEQLAAELGIADVVAFTGFDPNPHRQVANADVFALSSGWEGFGNVLVEALATGVAVVSTDCPSGPREILASGRFGALVPVGDCEALARAIMRAKRAPEQAHDVAKHLKQFESHAVARRYLDVMGLARA